MCAFADNESGIMPTLASVRVGSPSLPYPATSEVAFGGGAPLWPADVDVTRYASILGRDRSVTAPVSDPSADPHRFSVEFWDVQELYNHHNDKTTQDPKVPEEAYLAKLDGLAARIRETNPDILGLAGVENLRVLEDLAHERLADLGYTILHIDTPDPCGLDTAVLTKFPITHEPALHVVRGNDEVRGVLETTLDLGGVPMSLFVVQPKDEVKHEVARMVRHLAAEKRLENPSAEIMVMGAADGDFLGELGATAEVDAVKSEGAPFFDLGADTSGSSAILVTSGLLDDEGLRLVPNSTTTIRDHLLSGGKPVSKHPRLRAEVERAHPDRPKQRAPLTEGKLIAPGVWLRDDVVTVRHRIGDPVPPHDASLYAGLQGEALAAALDANLTRPLVASYYEAREALFSEIANEEGWVECVYTGKRIQADGIPLHDVMNTEHTRPKSRDVVDTKFVSDLHHLFPTDSKANTKRGSVPFGIVEHVEWEDGGSKFGTDAEGRTVFEPRDEHKGTVARALAYLTLHGIEPEPWQKPLFTAWNETYGAGDAELRRNDLIAKFQGNRNPFIDEPALMARLWST